jgi:hypothetical protein
MLHILHMYVCWLCVPLIHGYGRYEADNLFAIYGSISVSGGAVLHVVKLNCDNVSSLILSEGQVALLLLLANIHFILL